MNVAIYIVPVLIIAVILYALFKKVNVFTAFTSGAKEALPLIYTIFPTILAVLIMSELFEVSGLSAIFIKLLSPVLKFFGIPTELTKLVLLKPFSGSGSLALLDEIYKTYGVNSYISLSASAIFGSSETTFYVSAVYYSKCKNKNAAKAIIISLTATFLGAVFSCFICKFFY